MRAGRLRHTITIQSAAESRDGAQTKQAYTTVTTRRAEVKPLQGAKGEQLKSIHADATHTITIRHYSALTPKHRLLCGARVFTIISILPDVKATEDVIVCKEALG